MPHPAMRCKNDGKLLVIRDMKSERQRLNRLIYCKICNKNSMMYAFYCDSCFNCYCLGCGRNMVECIQTSSGKLCVNGHKLEWILDSPNDQQLYQCSICKNTYDCGCLYCKTDDLKYCLNDIKALN